MIDLDTLEITTLAEKPELYKETISLIESGFGYESDNSFEVDFAPLVQKRNFKNLYIIIDADNNVLSHLGFLEKKIVYKDKEFPIVMLGGIVTKTEAQGLGLFRKLYEHSISKYSPLFFVLWGSEERLYNKFDFYYAGAIFQNEGTQGLKETYNEVPMSKLSDSHKFLLKELYSKAAKDFWHIKRTDDDWEELYKITSTKLYMDRNCYCFRGKGRDLTNIIHEGYPFVGFRDNKYWLPFPGNNSNVYPLGMFKVGNKSYLDEFCEFVSNGRLRILSVDKVVKLVFEGQELEVEIQDFIPGLLGPYPLEEFQEFSPQFYFSGLDSI